MGAPLLTLALLALLVSLSAADGGSWSYEGDTGPSHWGDVSGTCASGQRQSPINIPEDAEKEAMYQPFIFTNFDQDPVQTWEMTNNGHTVQVTIPSDADIKTAHGGLMGSYLVKQFHFHWGSSDDQGSEHQVAGRKYPLEMHIVHFHEGESDPTGVEDGLAVLGVFFEIGETDNAKFDSIIDHLHEVTAAGDVTHIDSFKLEDFLPEDTERFYRYAGSLTTPDCNQAVIWTLFKDTVEITEEQLETFRELHGAGGHEISDNFRPVQDLNGRVVKDWDPNGSAKYGTPMVLLLLSVIVSSLVPSW